MHELVEKLFDFKHRNKECSFGDYEKIITAWLEEKAKKLTICAIKNNFDGSVREKFREILGLSEPARECAHEGEVLLTTKSAFVRCKKCKEPIPMPTMKKPNEAPMQQEIWCKHIVWSKSNSKPEGDYFYSFGTCEGFQDRVKASALFCQFCATPRPAPRKSLALWQILQGIRGGHESWAKKEASAALDAVLEVVDDLVYRPKEGEGKAIILYAELKQRLARLAENPREE